MLLKAFRHSLLALSLILVVSRVVGAEVAPAPTIADAHYGPHARNVLDLWQAKSERPAPLVIYIHGGGFISGDKAKARDQRLVQQCLDAGVSFAAINYRYLSPEVPMLDVLHDCARAVQFLRAQAEAWHLDKTHVAVFGSSAGAGTALWLAFHDDLADPKNTDSVLRESTRPVCAGALSPQFSYDFLRWRELLGEDAVKRFGGRYNSPALAGFKTEEEMLSDAGKKARAECDMLGLISKDDPPIFVSASLPDLALTNSTQFLHHPKHAQAIYNRCRELGVPVIASIPALDIAPPKPGPATIRDFVFAQLGVKAHTQERTAK